jgi:SAM-dependent methyltransferase
MAEVDSTSSREGGKSSPFVLACLSKLALERPLRALDVPCGFGRHASLLAELGFSVTGLDLDAKRVAATNRKPTGGGLIKAVRGDATVPLPFQRASFDLALVIHYCSPVILDHVEVMLRPGGHLIYETFGAQGENWVDLPRPSEVSGQLASKFDLLVYRERKAGPAGQAVCVKLLAQKRLARSRG